VDFGKRLCCGKKKKKGDPVKGDLPPGGGGQIGKDREKSSFWKKVTTLNWQFNSGRGKKRAGALGTTRNFFLLREEKQSAGTKGRGGRRYRVVHPK